MAKTAHLPAEYIPPTFSTRTPSPFSAGWRWGLLSRKIFSDFYFSDFARNPQMFGLRIFWILHSLFLSRNFFLFFSWLRSYLDLYSILQNICRFNSLQVFARYSSSASFYIHHVWISRFQTLNFDSFLLVEFYSYQFRLVSALSIIRFDSLSLLLVINKHLCLCKVWFMLVLAILRLSDVFSFVLGVVYRLGLK